MSAAPGQAAAGQAADASAIVDQAVKEWLDRRTATALATAPGIDEREQGKRQGIEQLRYLHLDDYWYTLTPAILAAIAAQEPDAADGLVAQLRDLAKHWEREYASDQNWPQQCAREMVRLLDKAEAAGPRPAPELAAAMDAPAALARVLSWFAPPWPSSARHEATATRAQLARAYQDGGLAVPEDLRRFL